MGISYELREYEVDPDGLAAVALAAKIGLPPEQLFKTLVAQGDSVPTNTLGLSGLVSFRVLGN